MTNNRVLLPPWLCELTKAESMTKLCVRRYTQAQQPPPSTAPTTPPCHVSLDGSAALLIAAPLHLLPAVTATAVQLPYTTWIDLRRPIAAANLWAVAAVQGVVQRLPPDVSVLNAGAYDDVEGLMGESGCHVEC